VIKPAFRVSLLVVLGSALFAWSDAPPPGSKSPLLSKHDLVVRQAQEIRDKLDQKLSLENGLENVPLHDAETILSDRLGVTILFDREALKAALGAGTAEEIAVSLPKVGKIKASTILRMLMLAGQLSPTYLVQQDHVLITTLVRARPEMWIDNPISQEPVVDVAFHGQSLDQALLELASLTGINVVLDMRAAEEAKTPVTATLNNAPISTAVSMLADMANLESVTLKGALYVTTSENANQLRVKQAKSQAMQNAGGM